MLICSAAAAQTLKVDAPNLVATGENFNVTFVWEGENKPGDFSWTPGSGFQLVWGPQTGSSTSISIVNGKQTRSVKYTYTYILCADAAGKFTLPSASCTVKGETVSSQPLQIEVVSNGGASSRQQQDDDSAETASEPAAGTSISDSDIYLRLHLSKTNPVVGEPVTATLKLYQRVDIAGFDDARFPNFDGFWSQDLTPQGDIQFKRENVNDRIYNTAVIRKYVLIPQKSGNITIDPAELVCRIYVRTKSRGGSIFDSFFDDGYTTVRRRVSTSPVTMRVSALPAGAPASFGGGVGKFDISARLNRDSLTTHEAASLFITVSGKGNVSLVEAPKVSFPPDFEVYDTKAKESVDKGNGGISGSKTYEYPFIPRSHGDFTIPAVEYSYYDISAGRYVTKRTDPIELHVAQGNESPQAGLDWSAPSVSKKGVKNLGEDIRFISVKVPQFREKDSFFVLSAGFWLILLSLVALACLVYLLFRKLAARRADVAGMKTRKATKKALKRLRAAETYLKSNVYGAFYEELYKAMTGFISDKLNMPVASLSRENISARLREAGVTDELVADLEGILDACEFARYAPATGHDAMAAHYEKAASIISAIDSTMKNKKVSKSAGAMLLLLPLLIPSVCDARTDAGLDSLWNSAAASYADGRWEDAAASWTAIYDAGYESPELYCNIADAHFRNSEVEKSILWYERALKLDPSYDDARYNMGVADSRIIDDIEAVPQFFLRTWMRRLSYKIDSGAWAVTSLVLFALTLALILVFLLSARRAWRMTGFFSAIAALILSLFAFGFSASQRAYSLRNDRAVVMAPVVSAKSSPSDGSATDLFVLHGGTRLKVIDKVGDWSNVELTDGRQGWVKTSSFEII